MSMKVDASSSVEPEVNPVVTPDFSSMAWEELIAYVMQMFLAANAGNILKPYLNFWPLYIVDSIAHYKLMQLIYCGLLTFLAFIHRLCSQYYHYTPD